MSAARNLGVLDERSFSAVKSIKASEICHSEFQASHDDMLGSSDTDSRIVYSPKPKRCRMSHSVVADNPCDTVSTVMADPHPSRSTRSTSADPPESMTQSRTGGAVDIPISAGHNHRKKMFSEAEIGILVKSCRKIITGVKPLSRDSIVQEISTHSEGHLLIERYSISQLMTRLTYERRKLKMSAKQ